MSKGYLLGIDIGGTKCSVVLGNLSDTATGNNGKPLITDKITLSTEHDGNPYDFIEKILTAAERLIKNNRQASEKIHCIGISSGGPLNSKEGIILSPPNLPGWDKIPIVRITEKRLGIKTRLQNDANAGAIAEWMYGAGRGSNNMVFLTFGTGLGAGLILNGRLYTGTNDFAGEAGHIRLEKEGPEGYGKPGSFEGFCSGAGIANLGKAETLKKIKRGINGKFSPTLEAADKITAKIICDAAKAGDRDAVDILKISGYYLGKGLSILIDLLNPQVIVIGSIFTRCSRFLKPEAEAVIREEALSQSGRICRILPSELGENIGDYAALAVAAMEV